MKRTFLILGASALAFAASPALAKPDHAKGHGKGNHPGAMAMSHHGDHSKHYTYGKACPPGLAKKNAMCMPPGQFKKLYAAGQRYPSNYGNLWGYNQIPLDLRNQYGFQSNYRYYYGDGYLYQVDPTTMLVRQVVNAIMR